MFLIRQVTRMPFDLGTTFVKGRDTAVAPMGALLERTRTTVDVKIIFQLYCDKNYVTLRVSS